MWRLQFRRQKKGKVWGTIWLEYLYTESTKKKGKRMCSEDWHFEDQSMKYECFIRREIDESEAKWNCLQRVKEWKRCKSMESPFWFFVWKRCLKLWFLKRRSAFDWRVIYWPLVLDRCGSVLEFGESVSIWSNKQVIRF